MAYITPIHLEPLLDPFFMSEEVVEVGLIHNKSTLSELITIIVLGFLFPFTPLLAERVKEIGKTFRDHLNPMGKKIIYGF
jgi:hypothetical protein